MQGMELISCGEMKVVLDRKTLAPDKEIILCACIQRKEKCFSILTRCPDYPEALEENCLFNDLNSAVARFKKINAKQCKPIRI